MKNRCFQPIFLQSEKKIYACFEVLGKLYIEMEYSEKIVYFLSNFFEAGIDHIAVHGIRSAFWR